MMIYYKGFKGFMDAWKELDIWAWDRDKFEYFEVRPIIQKVLAEKLEASDEQITEFFRSMDYVIEYIEPDYLLFENKFIGTLMLLKDAEYIYRLLVKIGLAPEPCYDGFPVFFDNYDNVVTAFYRWLIQESPELAEVIHVESFNA